MQTACILFIAVDFDFSLPTGSIKLLLVYNRSKCTLHVVPSNWHHKSTLLFGTSCFLVATPLIISKSEVKLHICPCNEINTI